MADLDTLLAGIAAGDACAFERWLAGAERPLREGLRGFAVRVDVEAVLQETLLRVWQVAPRVVPDGRANALLRVGARIARNLAISEMRRLHGTTFGDDALDEGAGLEPGDPGAGPDPLLRKTISECREKLPDRPSAALEERLRTGGTEPDEVLAARLGMKTNTFLQNFTRARKLLAECLEARGVDLHLELR